MAHNKFISKQVINNMRDVGNSMSRLLRVCTITIRVCQSCSNLFSSGSLSLYFG